MSQFFFFFFFAAPATTEIYTLSLHDALPISWRAASSGWAKQAESRWSMITRTIRPKWARRSRRRGRDRKSTRLNSSHVAISYAVFCLKKKKYKGFDEGEMMSRANGAS